VVNDNNNGILFAYHYQVHFLHLAYIMPCC